MRIITIKCAKCGSKVLKYQKMGKGRLWRCWKGRIIEDRSVRQGDVVKCTCGNVIGFDKGGYIRMRQSSFTLSS